MNTPLMLSRLSSLLLVGVVAGCSGHAGNTSSIASPTGPSALGSTRALTTPLAETVSTCAVNISGVPQSVSGRGGSFTLTLTAAPDCSWTGNAINNGTGVTPRSGRGSSSVSISTEPNPDHERITSIDFNGTLVQFSQPNGCTYTLDQKSLTVDASGGRVVFMMTTFPGCAWFSKASDHWIDVKEAKGEGPGEIPFEFDPNFAGERHANLTIVNAIIPITQRSSR
ncbi:MAG: hypothetical protein ABL986_16775 [Vicinamibacterales bacterium]